MRSDQGLPPLLLLFSPIAVIAIGNVTARVAGPIMGAWAWVPVLLVFWILITGLVHRGSGPAARARWLARPRRARRWVVLGLLASSVPLGIFLQHWALLMSPLVFGAWLAVGLINPVLEETYWRGLLLDAASAAGWPSWLGPFYTSVLFALSHPLMLGVNSVGVRHPAVIANTFLLGLLWSKVFRTSGSLRWPILMHVLVDLLALSVPVFLNLYVPPPVTR